MARKGGGNDLWVAVFTDIAVCLQTISAAGGFNYQVQRSDVRCVRHFQPWGRALNYRQPVVDTQRFSNVYISFTSSASSSSPPPPPPLSLSLSSSSSSSSSLPAFFDYYFLMLQSCQHALQTYNQWRGQRCQLQILGLHQHLLTRITKAIIYPVWFIATYVSGAITHGYTQFVLPMVTYNHVAFAVSGHGDPGGLIQISIVDAASCLQSLQSVCVPNCSLRSALQILTPR